MNPPPPNCQVNLFGPGDRLFAPFEYNLRNGEFLLMGDRKVHSQNPFLGRERSRATVKPYSRSAPLVANNFNLAESRLSRSPRTQRLQKRFLCRKPRREMLVLSCPAETILRLSRQKELPQEALAVPLDALSNTSDVHYVNTRAEDHDRADFLFGQTLEAEPSLTLSSNKSILAPRKSRPHLQTLASFRKLTFVRRATPKWPET